MSVEEVARDLLGVLARMDSDRAAIIALRTRATAARSLLAGLTTGSAHPLTSEVLTGWDATIDGFTKAAEQLERAYAALREYLTVIGVAAGPGLAPAPAGAAGEVPGPVREAADRLRWPAPGTNHTYGIALDQAGSPIWTDANGDPNIQSGRIGPGAGAPGLRRDAETRWHQIKSAVEHVEGHIAAVMRRPGGPRHVSLLLTQPPCPQEPYGCKHILPALLPAGAMVDVYVADRAGGSPKFYGSYTGTGEGVNT